MLALGAATFTYLHRFSLDEALDHLAKNGFREIELMSTPPHLFPRQLNATARSSLRKGMERRGLSLFSLQPTYQDLNIISLNPAIRSESVREVVENIELAADLGAKVLVLVTGRRHPLLPVPLEKAWGIALDSIGECNEIARKRGVVIGIENVRNQFVDRGSDVCKMVADLADGNVKAVIDVANANVVESPLEALEAVKEHLVLVHLSDNDGRSWTHSSAGKGNIDFPAIAGKLRDIGFQGPSILEVTDSDDPLGAMERSKAILESCGWQAGSRM
jgi:sugar phosphate isomerase/epimerase